VVGSPLYKGKYGYSFTPVSIPGMSDDPPLKNQVCYGIDLKNYNTTKLVNSGEINLAWLIELYKAYPDKEHFFRPYFTKLTGGETLRKQIEAGKSEQEIRNSWEPALRNFKIIRSKYLLYN
jgi:uncharacterized protein YbbC (DUF1343 family)